MEILANITKLDLIQSNLYLMFRSRPLYIIVSLGSAFILFSELIILINRESASLDQVIKSIFVALIYVFIFLILTVLLSSILLLIISSKKNGILGSHCFAIQNDGFRETTVANDTLHRWEGITSIAQSKSYIFVSLTPYLYHIIPKRVFDTQEDCNQFWQKLNEKWKEHN